MSMSLFYALVFLTPFVFVENTNELFEFPKMYFVYFAGSLFILLELFVRKGWFKLQSFDFPLLGLVISFAVSTVFSSHLYTSLWGYFSRFNGGLISVLVFCGIYVSIRSLKPQKDTILKTVSLTLVPISALSIIQHLGLGGTWATDTTVRAFSTFGQPNWYGAYASTVLPIILFLGMKTDTSRQNKVGWFVLFVFGFLGFWFAYSVSGIVGLMGSVLLLLVLNRKLVNENFIYLIVTGSVCLLLALLNPGILKQKVNDALKDFLPKTSTSKNIGYVGEMKVRNPETIYDDDKYTLTDSGFIRKSLWSGTVELAVSSPRIFLIGTGPETFPYEFQKFRPETLNYSSEWNYILNKPHNYYLELLAQNGVIGLLIYVLIVIKVLIAKDPVLSPALFGFFVTNIFGWPTVSNTLFFWVFLALLVNGARKDQSPEDLTIRHTFYVLILVLCLAVYGYLNMQFIKQYKADIASKKSDYYFEKGDVKKALSFSNDAIHLNKSEPYYYRQRAKSYILSSLDQDVRDDSDTNVMTYRDVLKAAELNPNNPATLRGLVSLYYFLAVKDLSKAAQESGPTDFHEDYRNFAKTYYQELSNKYPRDAGVLTLVAKYQKMLGLENEYFETVKKIKSLRPDLLDWYLE